MEIIFKVIRLKTKPINTGFKDCWKITLIVTDD